MKARTLGSPFGSVTRSRALMAVSLLGASYQRELSRLLGTSPSVVQKALSSLERDGLVSGRMMGRTRTYSLNRRFFARTELDAFLRRLAAADADLQTRTAELRRRPRRAGKRL
jgi:DNA-binding transcriptional ArsR family regulator